MTADQMVQEIKAAAPTREQQIGNLAAKGLAECAETAVASIQDAMQTVQDNANAVLAEGTQLIDAIRLHSKGFQDRVADFTKLQESIALKVKAAGNDVATFGNDG